MSVAEYEKGWFSKPTPAAQRDRAFTVLSPRFCIAEQHGNQKPKYRVFGDLTKSHVSLTVGESDTYCPQDLDTFMVLARLQHKYGATNLRMWSLGFSNAYKTIGMNEESKDASHICLLNPKNKRLYNVCVLVQPFGSRRSPANWGRVVTFLQFAAEEILHVSTGAFVDDVFCSESHRLEMSGFWAFKQLCGLIGFPASKKKDQPPSTGMVLLGADASLRETHIQSQVRGGRLGRLNEYIPLAIESDSLTPASAIKLRGELGFYPSLLEGKLGRGMMGPLIKRQYSSRGGRLSPEPRRNLAWWYSALGKLAPRTAPFEQLRPVGAHTDAQGRGRVSAVYYGNRRAAAHAHLLERLSAMAVDAEGESPIFLYELCAAILLVYIANGWMGATPRTRVLCVDNQAAVAARIKGISPPDLAGSLVNLFWNVAARGNTRWRVEYVDAKSSSSDSPSRQCKLPTEAVRFEAQGQIPTEFRDAFSSSESLRREAAVFTKRSSEIKI